MYEVNPKSAITLYGVGGGGFYRKVTNFTDPQQGYYCDYFLLLRRHAEPGSRPLLQQPGWMEHGGGIESVLATAMVA